MKTLHVRHRTTYTYSAPVELGRHRLMVRPRDSHDLRLIEATLTLDPPAAATTWVHDVFGNSIALLDFAGTTTRLEIVSELVLDRYDSPHADVLIAPEAETYPFVYGSDERIDLGRLTDRHHPDGGAVRAFVERVAPERPIRTLDLLNAINKAIQRDLAYNPRYEEGTRTPAETLAQGGTCRDFALLFMEAARELGLAARFVTGYLFDGSLDGPEITGAGQTHAWAEVFLPGPGWIEFDPTNGLIGSDHLVRVAVVRDPKQASPVSGSFTGFAQSSLMAEVTVRSLPAAAPLAAPEIAPPPPATSPLPATM